ncbi:DrmB family protein [Dactylosporangium sp. McL0621]|uniref:DrmB family protein n=1 Tax=Dactylosporangium sp. McL0621 TaxID=3415678 RepID=UPI003CF9A578
MGAVFDVLGESLMGVDISEWPFDKTRRVESQRLEQALGVKELRSPPSVPSYPSKHTPGIPYQRFPRWIFCQECRRMRFAVGHEENGEAPKCAHCGGHMVPMRFIAVCAQRGHVMDVPWGRWAHSQAETDDQRRCRKHELRFDTRSGGSEGLSSLVVHCMTCWASRHLGDLPSRDSLKRIDVRCSGTQPWQRGSFSCDERLEVLQRGATNVTLPETTTALDIPEPSVPARNVEAEIRQHRNFDDVRTGPDGPRASVLIGLIAEDLGVTEDLVLRVARGGAGDSGGADSTAEARQVGPGLLNDEWQAFMQATAVSGEATGTPNFVVSSTELVTDDGSDVHRLLAEKVRDVVLVHRLREVRVLHGYRRYDLAADLVPVDLGRRGRERWLPAIESFGEGIFLSLDEQRLSSWERNDAVMARAKILERRRRDSHIGSRFAEVSPRSVLLHTLAHLLIRRLAFACGYSAASLRERVYSSAGPSTQAGFLIYTAAGDAEGTLGGLVRQGEPPRLAQTLLSALEEAAWCSADPVCRESPGQGLGSLNLAACHGCCLVAETSCERSNVLLDRVLVVGDGTTPGFFGDIVNALRTASAEQI